jgi:hypothetical protein
MNRSGLLILVVLAGCAPKFLSGSTECSTKNECPTGYFCSSNGSATKVCFQKCSASTACESGFVCGDDGINTDVCIDKSTTNCGTGETYYCKTANLCWTDSVACSTITNCGTMSTPDYRACTSATVHPDCAGNCVAGSSGTGGSAGSTGSGGAGGSGGSRTGGGSGGVSGSTVADAGVKDAGGSCTTGCSSGQKCLGGQCCAPPASGGECNQLPACGCASGKVCYPSSTSHAMVCLTGNNLVEGADCSSGLSCQSGFGCFGGTCKRYCNTDTDCPAVAGLRTCNQTTWSDDSTNILGVKVCGRICDPAHPQNPTAPLLSCPSGFGCDSSATGLSYCFQTSPLSAGSTCTDSQDCSPGYYCTVGGSCNKYCLVGTDCPSGQTCRSFSTTTLAGTYQVGYCGT